MINSKYIQREILAGIEEYTDTDDCTILDNLGFERINYVYGKPHLFISHNLGIFLKLAFFVSGHWTYPIPEELRIPTQIILEESEYAKWVIQDISDTSHEMQQLAYNYFCDNGWSNLDDIKQENVCVYNDKPMFLDW